MISKEEVRELLKSTETYRIERTTSTGDMDKFQEAICAFSNDLPNSKNLLNFVLSVSYFYFLEEQPGEKRKRLCKYHFFSSLFILLS